MPASVCLLIVVQQENKKNTGFMLCSFYFFCFFPLNNVASEVLLYLLQLVAQQRSINASKGCTYLLAQCSLSYVPKGNGRQ